MAESAGNAPASGLTGSRFRDECRQLISTWTPMAPSRGFAPRPLALTGRWTTVIPRWNVIGLPGRTSTCNLRVRSSAFCVFELRGVWNWSGTPVLPRVSRRPKRRGLLSSSCPIMATRTGAAPAVFPKAFGTSLLFLFRVAEVVGDGGNAPLVVFRPSLMTAVLQTAGRIITRLIWWHFLTSNRIALEENIDGYEIKRLQRAGTMSAQSTIWYTVLITQVGWQTKKA